MSSQPRFRFPAEWEPHRATWMIWPKDRTISAAELSRIRTTIVHFIAELAPCERVEILVDHPEMAAEAAELLRAFGLDPSTFGWHEVPTDDYWLRDSGPLFAALASNDGAGQALIGWGFNAWGGKFTPWEQDAAVPRRLAERLPLPLFEPGIILEGGSIDSNGAGVLLTTQECLLNPNRNPGQSRSDIERILARWLGTEQVIWLPNGLEGDHTDGHVDNVARFVSADTIVAAQTLRRGGNAARLRENERRLRAARDPAGRPFRIVTVPLPEVQSLGTAPLPASYVNFYIANAKVLVPLFNCRQDSVAVETLAGLFPGRSVVGIDARQLLTGGGAFHCITQPQPQAARRPRGDGPESRPATRRE